VKATERRTCERCGHVVPRNKVESVAIERGERVYRCVDRQECEAFRRRSGRKSQRAAEESRRG
jgi:hypothetical protein